MTVSTYRSLSTGNELTVVVGDEYPRMSAGATDKGLEINMGGSDYYASDEILNEDQARTLLALLIDFLGSRNATKVKLLSDAARAVLDSAEETFNGSVEVTEESLAGLEAALAFATNDERGSSV